MLKLLLNLLVYPLSFTIRRREKLWAFGSPDNGFEGNGKYLFLWISRNVPEVEAVWVTADRSLIARLRDAGYSAAHRWSWAGLIAALTGSVHLVTRNGGDINFPLSGGATVFNLWHGVGIKNILKGSSVGRNARLFRKRWIPLLYLRALERFRAPELILSTSATMTKHFARCFDVGEERCVEAGYPRQDPAFDEDLRRASLVFEDPTIFDLAAERYSRVYVYAPTLRQNVPDFLGSALPDLERLSSALQKSDAVLFVKPHPRNRAVSGSSDFEPANIQAWPENLEIYSVIHKIDCMVTDYSSLLYDYIDVRSSGVIIYDYDYERFISQERDLAFNFDDNIIGVRASSFADLCAAVEADAAATPLDPQRLKVLRDRFWGGSAAGRSLASETLARFLLGASARGRGRARVSGTGQGLGGPLTRHAANSDDDSAAGGRSPVPS